jgi:hypothetical protein
MDLFFHQASSIEQDYLNPSPKLPHPKPSSQSDFTLLHHDLDEYGSLRKLLLLLRQLQGLRLLHLWRKLSLLIMDEDGPSRATMT